MQEIVTGVGSCKQSFGASRFSTVVGKEKRLSSDKTT